jgi:hypothetical protein
MKLLFYLITSFKLSNLIIAKFLSKSFNVLSTVAHIYLKSAVDNTYVALTNFAVLIKLINITELLYFEV